jgi:hypothetical protein
MTQSSTKPAWLFLEELRRGKGVANDGGLYGPASTDSVDDGAMKPDRSYDTFSFGNRQVNVSSHTVWREDGSSVSVKPMAWAQCDATEFIYGEIEKERKGSGEFLVFTTDEIGRFVERKDVSHPS